MILIADSGSTKTEWRLIGKNRNISFLTDGLNPYYTYEADMRKIISNAIREIKKEDVSHVFFYGAGCSSEDKCNIVGRVLQTVFPTTKFYVESDMLGAARSLFGCSSGIAAILGTGSNTCLYNGKQILQNIPSLGFILGDEGSGSNLGKRFLTAFLRNELSKDITKQFEAKYNLTYFEILDAVYKKTFPNRWLAQFSIFLKENEKHHEIKNILTESLTAFFENQLCRYNHINEFDIGFTGSIAFHFSNIIHEIAEMKHIQIKSITKNPMDGLVDFHSQNQL